MKLNTFVGVMIPVNGVFVVKVEVRMSFSASAFWLLPMFNSAVEAFFHAKQIVV